MTVFNIIYKRFFLQTNDPEFDPYQEMPENYFFLSFFFFEEID